MLAGSAGVPGAEAAVPVTVSAVSSGRERVFKLKDGRAVRGRVVLDDPFYYNVATSTDRVEVVIKDDIAT